MTLNLQPKNHPLFFWGLGLLACFVIVLVLEIRGFFLGIDGQMTLLLQNSVPRSLDVPLSVFSILGTFEVTTLVLGVIAYWIFHRERIILLSLFFFGVLLVFELLSKFFVIHPGPPLSLLRYNFPLKLPLLEVKTRYSFPSGHVSRTTFLAVLTIFLGIKHLRTTLAKKLFAGGCLVFLAVMVLSRVYLGEHWTSDVLGGLFLGGSMALFALTFY